MHRKFFDSSLWARLISNAFIRMVFGGDLPKRDLRWMTDPPPVRVLDVGSGAGFYARHLRKTVGAGSTIVVTDIRHAALATSAMTALRRDRGLLPVVADAMALPFAEGAFDALLFGYSIEDFPNLDSSLAEAARLVRPGGRVVAFLWRPKYRRPRVDAFVAALLTRQFRIEHRQHGLQNHRFSFVKSTPPDSTPA